MSHIKIRNIFRYKQVVRLVISRGRVVENMGAAWFFQFWNSLEARSYGRSAEIVRFEIP